LTVIAVFQADADVDQFINEGTHTFDEYCKEVLKYQRLVDEISYNSEKVRPVSFCAVL
jgi:dynein heavy chain